MLSAGDTGAGNGGFMAFMVVLGIALFFEWRLAARASARLRAITPLPSARVSHAFG
jgi:hypothetical protein